MARRKSKSTLSIVLTIIFIIVVVAGYFLYDKYFKNRDTATPPITGDMSFHFMTLGNDAPGDSIYVKAGDNDILIDAGSEKGSVPKIKEYLDKYVLDNTLEYVIITHADFDHIAGFTAKQSIFDLYQCEVIIDFPLSDKTSDAYGVYQQERADEIQNGAKHFTALECYKESKEGAKRVYELGESLSMEILYNYYYENSHADENNYSVCVMFKHGDRDFLFTGDLEKAGEEKLAEFYDFKQVELFKAGHHGSATSSNEILLKEIKPKICVASCVAGGDYNFPRQDFIDRISKYTDKVYVTTVKTEDEKSGYYADLNGTVVVSSEVESVKVKCSNVDTLLKDTDWFKSNREMPIYWQ